MPAGGDTVDKESVFANYKSVFSRQFAVSLAVEFVGVMFFQILGGTTAKEYAPFVNGFALAVWIYVAANISGGHLNPAVSFSTAVCGFYRSFTLSLVPVYMGSPRNEGPVLGPQIVWHPYEEDDSKGTRM